VTERGHDSGVSTPECGDVGFRHLAASRETVVVKLVSLRLENVRTKTTAPVTIEK
jgi:hypothetical protein